MSSSTRLPEGMDLDPTPESFSGFFETWLHEQEHDLDELKAAARAHAESTQSYTELTRPLRELVGQVISHYEKYYRVKFESVQFDVLAMLTPSWRSSLEEAFLWIGGWRPSTAFHLLYSVMGSQFEAAFAEMLSGLETGDDLGDLTPSQLGLVDELHRKTVKQERELTELMAVHQETIADSTMVELSHIATELTRCPNSDTELVHERVESTLDNKEQKLREILEKADDLRLRTLKNVVDILSPIQAVHFLIAAAQLHLRVHEWGVKKDAGNL